MDEYLSREFMLKNLEADMRNNAEYCEPLTVQIMERFIRYVKEFPAADVETELRQLLQSQAEQIRQLKKMLLQACSDFDYLTKYTADECRHMYPCGDNCPLNSGGDSCKWMYEAEALALIGEDGKDNESK